MPWVLYSNVNMEKQLANLYLGLGGPPGQCVPARGVVCVCFQLKGKEIAHLHQTHGHLGRQNMMPTSLSRRVLPLTHVEELSQAGGDCDCKGDRLQVPMIWVGLSEAYDSDSH